MCKVIHGQSLRYRRSQPGFKNSFQGELSGILLRIAPRVTSFAGRLHCPITVLKTLLGCCQKSVPPLLSWTQSSFGTSMASPPMRLRRCSLFLSTSNMEHSITFTVCFLATLWPGGKSAGTAWSYTWWTAMELTRSRLKRAPLLVDALPRRLQRSRCRVKTLQTAQRGSCEQGSGSCSCSQYWPPFRAQLSSRQLQLLRPQMTKRAAILSPSSWRHASAIRLLVASCAPSRSLCQVRPLGMAVHFLFG